MPNFLKFLPDVITLGALNSGLAAIRLALDGDFRAAAAYVIISCLLDKADGGVARKLRASSDFGAQLDSLADFFDFGIVPGFVIYLWKMHAYITIKYLNWLPVPMLAICMAIRLARFNIALTTEDHENPLNKYFFKGIPAPMAAALVMLPLVLSFVHPSLEMNAGALVINTILISLLAVSTVPTPCFKKIEFGPQMARIVSMCTLVFLGGLLLYTWVAAVLICFLYILSIGISWFFYGYFCQQGYRKRNRL
jgi:CDP-diacylglycerol--serine O-phosphatidyltransferase